MTPVYSGCNLSFIKKIHIVAYQLGVTQSKDINKTETEINEALYGSRLVAFYNEKWGFVYTASHWLTGRCRGVIRVI